MSDNIKVISRPKVRFCQFSDNAQNKAEIVEDCGQQAVPQASGPRIKEIVTLTKPVKIVDLTKFANVCDKDISSNNCDIGTSTYDTNTTSDNIRNISNKNMPKDESKLILRDANDIQKTKNSYKMSQFNKSPQDDALKSSTKNMQQKGKENKAILLKRSISNKDMSGIRTRNHQHVQSANREKFKLSIGNNHRQKVNVQDFKRSKTTKSQSASSIMKKTGNSTIGGRILNAKSVSTHKTATKNNMSSVKKIVLRNVSGPKIKTYVEPGVFRKEQADIKTSNANERSNIFALEVPVEDLAQPKYNSIVSTINKLKELEQQKVVTDIDHLPSTLKNFLNGKISAVLDFPYNETIYKNLIDLSIDEKQLPSAITRSRDPEPRQKDIVPQLTDFFIPEDLKEICEAAHVKFRASKIDDNWNAFKISDKILEWKYNIDDID